MKNVYKVIEEKPGDCYGCFNIKLNGSHIDQSFCNKKYCSSIIWKKEETKMVDQKELELYILECLMNNSNKIQEEFYKAKIEEVLPDIQKLLSGNILENEVICAIRNYEYGFDTLSDSIFEDAIKKMESKLGYI